MRLGPLKSFLCLVPSPTESDTSPSIEEQVEIEEPSAAQSWSLLQPLAEKCLYVRSFLFATMETNILLTTKTSFETIGLLIRTATTRRSDNFTSYRKRPHQVRILLLTSDPIVRINIFTDAYMVQEDINVRCHPWLCPLIYLIYLQEDAYSLGRAPKTESGSDLSTTQVAGAELQNVELAKGVGSRYLVQRWGDGTLCDKTGEPRDIEIQVRLAYTSTERRSHFGSITAQWLNQTLFSS